jgi:hypothetical protein
VTITCVHGLDISDPYVNGKMGKRKPKKYTA